MLMVSKELALMGAEEQPYGREGESRDLGVENVRLGIFHSSFSIVRRVSFFILSIMGL